MPLNPDKSMLRGVTQYTH